MRRISRLVPFCVMAAWLIASAMEQPCATAEEKSTEFVFRESFDDSQLRLEEDKPAAKKP